MVKNMWSKEYGSVEVCGLMLKEVWTNCLGSVD